MKMAASCLLVAMCLFGCKTQESQVSFRADEAFVSLSRSGRLGTQGMPRTVYVFPALKCDENGVPIQQLDYVIEDDGSLYWLSPSNISAQIQDEVVRAFEDRGYTAITFGTLTEVEQDHRVMVVNAYYSVPKNISSDSGQSVNVVVFRLTGVTFPASMDPSGSVPVFDHTGDVMFSPVLDETSVMRRSFRYAVNEVGAEGGVARAIRVR